MTPTEAPAVVGVTNSASAGGGDSARRDEWVAGAVRSLMVFAASRLVVFGAIVTGTNLTRRPAIWGALQVYDAGWYLRAAEFGYPRTLPTMAAPSSQSTIAFFPVFPMTVRLVATATPLGYQSAAIAVSLIAGAIATVLLWLLAKRIAGPRAADRAVLMFCFFPATLALLMPFSEGVMLVSAIACLLFLLDRRWLWAGVAAALATATRPTALALVLACAWASAMAIRERREWKSLVAPALAPVGIVGYFLFLWHHTGSVTAWFTVQTLGWGHGSGGPLGTHAYKQMAVLFRAPLNDMNSVAAGTSVLFAVFGIGMLAWWRPPGILTVFALGATWFAMTTGIASRPRYMLAVFPIFLAIGAKAQGLVFQVLLATSATVMGLFVVFTTGTDMIVF